MATILIADDEKNIRATLSRSLQLEGHVPREADNGESAWELIRQGEADLAILDLEMPRLDGLAVLERMQEAGVRMPALVLTAHGTIDRAVRAVRLGAFDFIEKPPAIERILLAISNALRVGALEEENRRLAEETGGGTGLLGGSEPMRRLRETIARVGPTDAGVLLVGENGSGKELVARALHEASPRRARSLVTVNCAAIPETLFESELFGHARGAFTGATEARRGKFQRADGGTLFLDEVGEVPLSLQPKMLRSLESGEVERVGGAAAERVNVRVIAATNRDLESEVAAGRFRQDLYYRLLVVPIRVAPLRERRDDVPLLARHFLEAACRAHRVRGKALSPQALDVLAQHDWPGNVRELRNAMGRAAILSPGDLVEPEDLAFLHARGQAVSDPASWGRGAGGPAGAAGSASGIAAGSATAAGSRPPEGGPGGSTRAPAGPFDLAAEIEQVERRLVLQVLERCRWRMTRAAAELNLERSHLYKKLKALGIERPVED